MKTKSANLSTYHHSVIAVIIPKLLSRAKEYHKTTTHISAPVMWTLQSCSPVYFIDSGLSASLISLILFPNLHPSIKHLTSKSIHVSTHVFLSFQSQR